MSSIKWIVSGIFLSPLLVVGNISDIQIRELARGGNLDSALHLCQNRLIHNSENDFCLLINGKLTLNGEQSQDFYQKIISHSGASATMKEEALFHSGQYFYAKGIYLRAAGLFQNGLSQASEVISRIQSLYWLGQTQINLGYSKSEYLDSAKASFVKLIKQLTPSDYYYALALEGLAKTRIAAGELEDANETISMALEYAKPDQQSSLYGLKFDVASKIQQPKEM